jgi:hypothetical protein
MLKISEIKSAIAVAIAAAFGFIIALIWKDIIIGLMKLAKWWDEGGFADEAGAIKAIIVAVFITIVSVIGILLISKWGGVGQK